MHFVVKYLLSLQENESKTEYFVTKMYFHYRRGDVKLRFHVCFIITFKCVCNLEALIAGFEFKVRKVLLY